MLWSLCVKELISRYSSELHLSQDIVSEVLESLRQHAVGRLAADVQFSQTGVATLHIKFAGQLPPEVCHLYALSFYRFRNHLAIKSIIEVKQFLFST